MADDPGSRLSVQLPAVFTAGAGAVHLAAAVPHFADSVLLGSGFVAIGWAQLAVAALLIRRRQDRTVRWSAVALNTVAVATWAMSRTVGLPLGHPGPEAVGLGDVLTVALEILAVGLLVWRSRRAPAGPDRWRRAAVLASAWALVIGGSTLAIAGVGTHGPHGGAEPEHGEHVSEDDVAPRSWPGADVGVDGSPPEAEPDHPDTADHGAAHAHAPGEGH